MQVRAKRITIVPGKRIEARDAVLYVGHVPVFYFPYYSRSLDARANNFNFVPGYRNSWGPFILGTYTWFLNDQLDGVAHLDYRGKRGPGVGPDVNFHLGQWGEGSLRYYYTHDEDPTEDAAANSPIPNNRQRVYFAYQAAPYTNLEMRSMVRYQSDTNIIREFFEGEYRQNPQPSTYFEVNKFWQNFSLDTYVQPRLNDFLETVERLPDVRLTGYRQQLGATPVYYESESSAGYYRRLFAETNNQPTGIDFYAARADTFHQLLLPETLFGWLDVTPRVGGRFTYYSEASGPGATTDEVNRGVFNTGAELSFKASRLWPDFKSEVFQMDGLRHIIQPSVNYVYVPKPNYAGTNEIPQFDYQLASIPQLPIDFPDYNSIDSIDSENVIRYGLRNRVQTKRDGHVVDFADWQLYLDWRLRPNENQTTLSDLYSDLTLRPFSWVTFGSKIRYDIEDGFFRFSFNTVTLSPNNRWSWSFGHWYQRDDFGPSPTALGQGDNVLISLLFFRLIEDWGLSASHHYDMRNGIMQEQAYTIYHDMRSWTAALSLRVRDNTTGPNDVGVAFTFSLKAMPHYGTGRDVIRPVWFMGG
jgi:lipopolysaccharide assembly outer membrane protein LptD (OstA)